MLKSITPENEADCSALAAILAATPIGAVATYEQLTAAIGRDCRARRWLLDRAIAEIEAATGGLFSTVRGEGIMRLESASIPDVGLAAINKIRRTARRGYERLQQVRVNDLPPAEQSRIIAHRSQLGAISLVADGRKTQTLTKEIASTGQAIPAGRVLSMFQE